MKKYFFSCSIVLTLTALAKLYSAIGHAGVLDLSDPLFGISNRSVFYLAGGLELMVAGFLLLNVDIINKCVTVCWLTLVFVLYRVGAFLLHPGKSCPCLGNLTDAIHIPPQIADMAMIIILAYLFIGSYATLFWLWRRRRQLASGNSEVGVGG